MSDDLLTLDEMLARLTADCVPTGQAKRKIIGKLTLSGELTELRGGPSPRAPAPPPIKHRRVVIVQGPGVKWFEWNWETNQAKRYIDGGKGLLDYHEIAAPRAEFEALCHPRGKPGPKPKEAESVALADELRSTHKGWTKGNIIDEVARLKKRSRRTIQRYLTGWPTTN